MDELTFEQKLSVINEFTEFMDKFRKSGEFEVLARGLPWHMVDNSLIRFRTYVHHKSLGEDYSFEDAF